MATIPAPGRISFLEYLELERKSPEKHEYRGGELFLMSGGSPNHARLGVRMSSLLDRYLGRRCEVFSSDLRIYAAAVNEGMYPDVSVACSNLEFFDGKRDVITNPTLVVEVLSPSTRDYDIGTKAYFYRTIPSLETILLVDSEQQYVQVQDRAGLKWTIRDLRSPDAIVWQDATAQFTLRDVYDGISLANSAS